MAWNSYITGGEESIMRNIPRSWLAISRTIRFWRDSTAGLSWITQERNYREMLQKACWGYARVRGTFVLLKYQTDQNFKPSAVINPIICALLTRHEKMYLWSFSCRNTRMSVINKTCTSRHKQANTHRDKISLHLVFSIWLHLLMFGC